MRLGLSAQAIFRICTISPGFHRPSKGCNWADVGGLGLQDGTLGGGGLWGVRDFLLLGCYGILVFNYSSAILAEGLGRV